MWSREGTDLAKRKEDVNYDSMSEKDKETFDAEQGPGPKTYLAFMIIFAILALVFFCMVCCGRKQLRRAIDVIDASADYIAHNKRVIVVPNIHFILTLIVVIIWFMAMLCVASLNEIKPDPIFPQVKSINWEKKWAYLALFMLFGILWITAWIEYAARYIVIMGATTYYFNNSYA